MFWWNATAPQTSNDTQMQMCRKLVMILKRKSETGTELPYAFCLRMMVLFSFSSMTAKFVEPSRFQKNRILFSWGWQQKRIEAFHAFVLAT